jgi:putative endonuclease
MSFFNISLGQIGENLASDFLLSKKYSIRDRNFRCRVGEIDIVAEKNKKIYFIEVKTKVGMDKGLPYEAVNYYKKLHLKRAIQYYLLKKKIKDCKLSVGVVSILMKEDKTIEKISFYEDLPL